MEFVPWFFPSRRKSFLRKYSCSCVWLISWWLIKLFVEFLNSHKTRLWSQQSGISASAAPINGIRAYSGVRQGDKVMKGSFCRWRTGTWSFSKLEQGRGVCTWSLHKTSPIKLIQWAWKKTQRRELSMGASSKKNDTEQGSHVWYRRTGFPLIRV